MDLITILVSLVVFAAIVWLAFWIIDSAFPMPIKMPAKVIVGLLALLYLLDHSGLVGRLHL